MIEKIPDIKPDKEPDAMPQHNTPRPRDEGESPGLFEPLMVGGGSPRHGEITDLSLALASESAAFKASLPDSMTPALATLIRTMNCYYSNLIEGHDTHPIDIERAQAGDYSGDPEKRNLQLEAQAHISVQQWIDAGGLDGGAFTRDGLIEIHKQFCQALPDEFLWTDPHPGTGVRLPVIPGAYRQGHVEVGRHIPVSPGAIPRFMERFEQAYTGLRNYEKIAAAAASHHRLLWIHPFLDGNGRVARLMSYAVLREALDTGGLWSIARGLARNVDDYKKHLAACDLHRRNDLDGRGTLSEENLSQWVVFFLEICLDQVRFMRDLMQPERLHDRIRIWTAEEIRADRLPPRSDKVLEALLYRGGLDRGEIEALLGVSGRQARRVTSALLEAGVVTSASTRAPIFLAFPATLAGRWMPNLFPER